MKFMKNNNEIQIQFAPIELLEYNNGQIPGVPENPRTREDTKQRNLEKSIKELPEMTIARAALCFPYNGRFVVIGGNRRLEAQRALKRKEVPIIALPEDTPVEKLRRMALLDNESTGQTDWAKLAKDWSKDEIRAWNIETPKGWFNEAPGKKAEEDNYIEPEKLKPRVKPGEIWQLGEHRLMCGDSTNKDDVARLMNEEKAHMVFTDPPYGMNLNTDYSKMKGNGRKGKEYDRVVGDNEDFSPDLINTIFENFGYCNEIFLWGVDYYFDLIENFKDGNLIVWDKTLKENGDAGYNSEFELLWTKNKHKKEVIHFNWFRFFGLTSQDVKTRIHPTQKPLEVIYPFLEKYSKEKNIIVDIYGGSGSTLIACEQLNRKCYMMELTEHYCDVIINRWETLTGRKAVKIG